MDAATEVDSQQVGPSQEHVLEKQGSSSPTHLQILTGPGTCTGKIGQYHDKLVKFLDTLVTVAKSSYTLEQREKPVQKIWPLPKRFYLLWKMLKKDWNICVCMVEKFEKLYGSKEYQRNTQEQQQQTAETTVICLWC